MPGDIGPVPAEMNVEIPKRRANRSNAATDSRADWQNSAIRPRAAPAPARQRAVAPGVGVDHPNALGPTSRMPCSRILATSCRSFSAPAGPASEKPAEMTTSA